MEEELEPTEEENSTPALATISPMLTVSPEQVKEFQKNLTLLKESVLVHGVDYKIIMIQGQSKTIFYRSGWEKIAFFFKISTKIISTNYREYERQAIKVIRHPDTDKVIKKEPLFDKEGKPLIQKHYAYETMVKAFCGQISNDAVGACSSDESKTFHHPIHDIMSTSHTRAKGRAICAMIGAGLSFEEIAGVKQIKQQTQIQSQKRKRKQKQIQSPQEKSKFIPSR